MMIAEIASWKCGPYTVHQRPRFDNPAFAVYLVFRGDTLVGKHFSAPDLACCQWLERASGRYAEASAPLKKHEARNDKARELSIYAKRRKAKEAAT